MDDIFIKKKKKKKKEKKKKRERDLFYAVLWIYLFECGDISQTYPTHRRNKLHDNTFTL